jgi:intracellular septation protein
MPQAARLDPKLKFALELGPLALFFISYKIFDIWKATGVMVVAALLVLAISWWKLRRLPIMPMVTAVIVVVFGGLTWYFNNPVFIKMKPTVLYSLFAAALFSGLAFRRPILQVLFDGALHLTDTGWRILTWRWAFFFVALAATNEVVWRNFSESHWVTFKSFGFLPLTVLFAIAQTPLVMKHESAAAPEEEAI